MTEELREWMWETYLEVNTRAHAEVGVAVFEDFLCMEFDDMVPACDEMVDDVGSICHGSHSDDGVSHDEDDDDGGDDDHDDDDHDYAGDDPRKHIDNVDEDDGGNHEDGRDIDRDGHEWKGENSNGDDHEMEHDGNYDDGDDGAHDDTDEPPHNHHDDHGDDDVDHEDHDNDQVDEVQTGTRALSVLYATYLPHRCTSPVYSHTSSRSSNRRRP